MRLLLLTQSARHVAVVFSSLPVPLYWGQNEEYFPLSVFPELQQFVLNPFPNLKSGNKSWTDQW